MKSGMEIYIAHTCGSLGDRMNTLNLSNPPSEVENTGINMSSRCHVEPYGVSRLHTESDVYKGSTDTPQNGNAVGDCDHRTRRYWFCKTHSDLEMRMEPNEKQNPQRFSVWGMSVCDYRNACVSVKQIIS